VRLVTGAQKSDPVPTPSKGSGLGRISMRPSTGAWLPLMSLAALQSVVSAGVVDVIGYLRPPRSGCFQLTHAVFLPAPSPASRKKNGFILS
jgi:hypothetical protein